MSKRMRVTSNSTSLIPGKVHRRVFQRALDFPAVGAAPNSTTPTDFQFGLDNLPRRPNYVWCAEILKINYYFQDNKNVTAASDDYHVAMAISATNSTDLAGFLTGNSGLVNMVRRDEILDATSVSMHFAGTSGMTQRYDGEIAHDMTDTMGQGVLHFSNNLFLLAQTVIPTGAGSNTGLFVCAEVFFRYREVALEYYLSTQQDAMASGL